MLGVGTSSQEDPTSPRTGRSGAGDNVSKFKRRSPNSLDPIGFVANINAQDILGFLGTKEETSRTASLNSRLAPF